MQASGSDIKSIIETLSKILPLLIPIILIQWTLMIVALVKLVKSESQPKFMPKWAWALVIIFVNLIGSILYLTIGRKDE